MSARTQVIQDLTYTSLRAVDPTITYVNGGTAGSEVVSVSLSPITLTVKIASGVSTATQVKAAIDAAVNHGQYINGLAPLDLVSVTISGTGSNAQKTVVNAALAGGVTLTAASKQIQDILYTAKTGGDASNDIRVKYVTGSLNVGVSSSDITVTFPVGTTAAVICAAIVASSPANALVSATVPFGSPSAVQLLASASSFTNLAGGLDAVAPSVILQDLTFASDLEAATDNGRTITYTEGATAGAEVVTVSGGNVSIKIQNAVSTATQIKAAADASEPFNGTAASGTLTIGDYLAIATIDAVASSVVFQDLTYTAVTEGTDGDDITIEYVADGVAGAETVSVASTAITVHMDDTPITGSTANQIKAAVNADMVANLLVLVSGASANVQAEGGPTNLAGGVDAQAGESFTVGNEVFTFVQSGATGNEIDAETDNDTTATNAATVISSVLTGTVSAEATDDVVTITADAIDASGNDIVLTEDGDDLSVSGDGFLEGGVNGLSVTISGTAGNAQKTVNAEVTFTGNPNVNRLGFYIDNTTNTLTTSYVYFPFNANMKNLNVFNDEASGTKTVIFSFDGIDNHGSVLPLQSVQLSSLNRTGIYVKEANGAPAYRVFANGSF